VDWFYCSCPGLNNQAINKCTGKNIEFDFTILSGYNLNLNGREVWENHLSITNNLFD